MEESQEMQTQSSGGALLGRPLRRLSALVLLAVSLVLWVWGYLAIGYSNLPGETLPKLAAWVFLLGGLAMFLFMRSPWRAVACFLAISALLVLWWLLIPASNDRDWLGELSTPTHAEIDGDLVTLRNMRNFDWVDANDYREPRYYDETFDLAKIEEVDLILCYWDELRAIGHTIISFGFSDGKRVAVSIEIRREVAESYSTLKGIFKQFELFYVVGSELDIVKVRTNRRGEEVYLYPTRATPEQARALFLDYVERINELAENPEYYHTIYNNCTTNIVDHVNRIMPTPVSAWEKILLNGYSDEVAYDMGWLDDARSYTELRKRHYISARAKAAEDDSDFSERIREFPD